ncbi:uncharacterized protein [Mytilus edulis]|uniref:uncharacterized protein n=1 Tax=Mytilus edulis TaxID=6550 RepID=UPI0039F14BF9
MWKASIVTVLGFFFVFASAQQQQFNSACLAGFDKAFRKCFETNGGFTLDLVFSIITNGTSGPLPQNTNKAQLITKVCSSRESIGKCVGPIPGSLTSLKCTDQENQMMQNTLQSTGRALGGLCDGDAVEGQMPPCLAKFDKKFRACMTEKKIIAENFFKLLSNTSDGTGMTMQQLNNTTCSSGMQQVIVQCASGTLQSLTSNKECTQQESFMVGQTLQNMMATYQSICTGKPIIGPGGAPSECIIKFETDLNQCSMDEMKIPVPDLMMLLTKGQVPQGQDMSQLNQTICKNFQKFELCGKSAVANSGCTQRDLLITEGTFANMVITVGSYCHDTSVPGACMLTLQQQFKKCFAENGVDAKKYFQSVSQHKGALLGTSKAEAEEYCSKRHALYICMTKVIHQCPGAEQTMSMTGFDLAAMERSVGMLCADIPEYLLGLKCFEKPTAKASTCTSDMAKGITSISAKQMKNGLSMEGFFNDFCDVRVKQVQCDASAWPTCDPKAVLLKRKFECHMLPTRCHEVNEDEIRQICPEEAILQADKCVADVKQNIKMCLDDYNIDPDIFLVNITHDRTKILGTRNIAQKFCQNRKQVYKCIRDTITNCPGAKEKLSRWGHQQNLLEDALNIVCSDLNVYAQGVTCMPDSAIQTCVKQSENRLGTFFNQADKMSNGEYFRNFCEVKLDHMQCDIDAMRKQKCSDATIGLKTEFECKLIQDRCIGLKRKAINNICNENSYNRASRQSASTNNIGQAGGNVADNGAASMSITSAISAVGASLFATVFLLL